MGKKSEKLKSLVQKLSRRYGPDDPDVARLRNDWQALEVAQTLGRARRGVRTGEIDFRTAAKRLCGQSQGVKTH